MRHWLFKSEPDAYGWDLLVREGRTPWSGVRNFQARNLMCEMAAGDLGFFYHSSVVPPGIVGIVRVARTCYPDTTALDPESPYFDPRATPEKPRWAMVDVVPVRPLRRFLTLDELRGRVDLEGMPLLRRGQRLSVQPVAPEHWYAILALEETPPG